MRILFIHNRYSQRGGEDTAIEMETSLLLQRGHDVKIIFFDNPAETDGLIRKMITFKNAIHNSKSAAILDRAIREFHPDIIHVHNLFFVASPAVLKEAARHRIPVIYTVHNFRLICSNALLLRNNKPCEICVQKKLPLAGIRFACYRKSAIASTMVTLATGLPKLRNDWRKWVSHYVVLTDFAREKLLNSSLGATPEQLVVKPNFIHDRGMGSSQREPYFLYVGRLSEEKGISFLMEAFRRMPDKKLLIVGDGPEKALLSDTYKTAGNIEFVGNRGHDEVVEIMKKSQALIFPSIWYEGLPYVILESFSTGTPVIASRLGSMTSLIQENYNGLFFKPGDVQDIQRAILDFVERKMPLYQQSRDTYLNFYNPEIHYKSIIEIYKNSIQSYAGTKR
jgi:glycosyltransferase involved in cell wall biosynthesis